MEKLKLKTLLYMMKSKNYEIRSLGMDGFAETCREDGKKAARIVCSLLRDEDVDERRYDELMECRQIGPATKAKLEKDIKDMRKTDTAPMDCIMEMYHSGDEDLIKAAKTCTVDSFSKYIYDMIHQNYPTYTKYTDELYQSGVEGLLKALENYDENLGAFTTHAKHYMYHELNKQINFHNNDLTPHFYSIQKQISNAMSDLNKKGMDANIRRVSKKTDLSPEVVKREMDFMNHTNFRYLDDENDKGLQEIEDTYSVNPERAYTQKEKAQSLQNAIDALSDKEKDIIEMKFFEGKTNDQIAKAITEKEQKRAAEEGRPAKPMQVGEVKTLCNLALRQLRKDSTLNSFYSDYQNKAEQAMRQNSVPVTPSEEQEDVEAEDMVMAAAMLAGSADDDEAFDVDSMLGSLRLGKKKKKEKEDDEEAEGNG